MGDGGGIFASATSPAVVLSHTIVAENVRGFTLPAPDDDDLTSPGSFSADHSLIGVDTGATIIDGGGNQIGTTNVPIDPLLGTLQNNGGPTLTHAPAPPAVRRLTWATHWRRRASAMCRSPTSVAGSTRASLAARSTSAPWRPNRSTPTSMAMGSSTAVTSSPGNVASAHRHHLPPKAMAMPTDDQDVDNDDLAAWENAYGALPNVAPLVATAPLSPATADVTTEVVVASDIAVMSVATVDTELDVVDFTDGLTSLREAIFAANTFSGADTIEFDPSLAGKTILLTQGELLITDDLVINGLGDDLLTIDASGNDPTPDSTYDDLILSDEGDGSRVFNIDDGDDSFQIIVAIEGLTLTGGDPLTFGGAIFSKETLSINESTISGNQAYIGGGIEARGATTINSSTVTSNLASLEGGGIYATPQTDSDISITDSIISENRAFRGGGGIFARLHGLSSLSIASSTITSNSATRNIGPDHSPGFGGGLLLGGSVSGSVSIDSSTISGNYAHGNGGGILAWRLPIMEISQSTISGNSVRGTGRAGGGGGGVWSHQTDITITDSTISGNSSPNGGGLYIDGYGAPTYGLQIESSTISGNEADLSGGGLFVTFNGFSSIDLVHSTVTNNFADVLGSGSGSGGGLHIADHLIVLDHTIVADNHDNSGVAPDAFGAINGGRSLIGDNTGSGLTEAPIGSPDANGNFIGGPTNGIINPQLGPLQHNGGPTQTHAPLPGSPAIDTGDPLATPGVGDVPLTDQRGGLYTRVFGSQIDIGAVEVQPQHADFNGDGVVNGRDFLAWQRGFGTPAPLASKSDGDADNDQDVDYDDLAAWENAYGALPNVAPLVAVAIQPSHTLPVEATTRVVRTDDAVAMSHADLVDLALAAATLNSEFGSRPAESLELQSNPTPVREEAFAGTRSFTVAGRGCGRGSGRRASA